MVNFDRFTLSNGLRVLVHPDSSTPMAVINVMYDVGAKDEDPAKTGFAHLFEHLMFGGSANIPVYDEPLQMAGGENNAYTTNDLTNYYLQIPAENLETGFWLESDRMLKLAFSKKSLNVQKKVVAEEFKEHYLNKPYGDVWHKMRELAYKEHPYKWMTIGKQLSHIEDAGLQDVKDFFNKHYTPMNAILVVAGNVTTEHVRTLAEKWFGPIPAGNKYERNLPVEPAQTAYRKLVLSADVPLDAFYRTYHMGGRLDDSYYTADLISEIFTGGGSSRLYQALVKEKQLFSSIDCSHFGSVDPGMMAISGKLVEGVKMEDAEKAIDLEIEKLQQDGVTEAELEKVKNKTESMIAFEDMSIMNRANSLAFYELLGEPDRMNYELEKYHAVTAEAILQNSRTMFSEDNANTIYYFKAHQ